MMYIFLFNLLINSFDIYLLHKFFSFFGDSNVEKKKRWIIYVTAVMLNCIVNQLSIDFINLLFIVGIIFIISTTYKISTAYRALLSGCYLAFGLVAELLSYIIWIYYFDFLPVKIQYPIIAIICELLRVLFLFIIYNVKNNRMPKLDVQTNTMLISVLILSVLVCIIAINIIKNNNRYIINILSITLVVFILGINIMFWRILQKLQASVADKKDTEMLLQEARAKEQYYKEVEKYNDEIKRIKHDFKNRLLALNVNFNENEKVSCEILNIVKELDLANRNLYTSNVIINTIINKKIEIAEINGIDVEVSIVIPDKLNIEYSDAGIILGNLFDNAIEACQRVDDAKKRISLKMIFKGEALVFKMTNTKKEEYADIAKSSKKDPYNHGIGLKSVKQIVEKYNGVVDFVDQKSEFVVNVSLYCFRV